MRRLGGTAWDFYGWDMIVMTRRGLRELHEEHGEMWPQVLDHGMIRLAAGGIALKEGM